MEKLFYHFPKGSKNLNLGTMGGGQLGVPREIGMPRKETGPCKVCSCAFLEGQRQIRNVKWLDDVDSDHNPEVGPGNLCFIL
jgi:hypothetical protein